MASFMLVPKVIDELTRVAQGSAGPLYARAVANGIALGRDPGAPTHLLDFSSESVVSINQEVAEPTETVAVGDGATAYRRRGTYWFDVRGVRGGAVSLKELLAKSLKAIEGACPGTLEKLSHNKPRSRRIVARNPKDLFDEAHLVEKHSEQLMDGWWYGTNNSADGTMAWLQRACSCAGLKWGKDFKTNLGTDA
jgi:hypothetical protein